MNTRDNNHKLLIEAFELYSKGLNQKQIAQQLKLTEKTVGNWKKLYKWNERLLGIEKSRITNAYLLIEENIRKRAQAKSKAAMLLLEEADQLNAALSTLHQVLKENHLIGQP